MGKLNMIKHIVYNSQSIKKNTVLKYPHPHPKRLKEINKVANVKNQNLITNETKFSGP